MLEEILILMTGSSGSYKRRKEIEVSLAKVRSYVQIFFLEESF